MELKNFWWLLIWLFTAGIILERAFPKQKERILGKERVRWKILPAILLVLPYIIWAGFRGVGFGDTYAYHYAFLSAPTLGGGLGDYLMVYSKDKGFYTLNVIIKTIFGGSDVVYFLILAAIQLLIIAFVCRRMSVDYWLSIFLFVASTDYLSWMFNGIRQFTAAVIIFSATELIIRKKYIPSVLLILLASTMHQSALIMLPVIFLIQGKAFNKKTVICVLLSVTALAFIDQFTDFLSSALADTQYKNVVSDWKSFNDDGTNPLRVLVYAMPTLIGLYGYRKIRAADDPIINLGIGAGLVSTCLGIISMATSGIFLGRMPIYVSLWSNLIVLPWEIKNVFSEKNAVFVKAACVLLYCAFFYYQMHITWNML